MCHLDSKTPTFSLYSAGQEADILENSLDQNDSEGELVEFTITEFTVYCKFGHVLAFDSDLIKRGKELFIAGKVSKALHTMKLDIITFIGSIKYLY